LAVTAALVAMQQVASAATVVQPASKLEAALTTIPKKT
jgi:hypothetical protein